MGTHHNVLERVGDVQNRRRTHLNPWSRNPDPGGRIGEQIELQHDGVDLCRRNDAERIINEGKGCGMVGETSGRRYDSASWLVFNPTSIS